MTQASAELKVCIGLKEVAGYYHNLKNGLRSAGVAADLILLQPHQYQYGGDDQPNWLIEATQTAHNEKRKVREILLRLLVLLWAITRYDVFIFSYGASFLRNYELPLLKLLHKRVIYVFHGSDARPPYINGAVMADDKGHSTADCIRLTAKQKQKLRRIERYADVIVSYPHYGHFHEKSFVDFMLIGFPYSRLDQPARIPSKPGEVTRILHFPSHPEGKGTFQLRQIIDRLKAKGYAVELIEITKQPNQVVMAELQKCDLVFDQLYSDIFLSASGTEAAYAGKALVIGGYGLEAAKERTPAAFVPPAAMCHPDDAEALIERLMVDSPFRDEMGEAGAAFIRAQWSAAAVGARFLRLINGDIPAEWTCDPAEIRYLHGYGLPENKTRALVKAVITAGGVEALQLGDKPALERLFVNFSEDS